MHPRDQLFCEKTFIQICLGIRIVWKFMSEGVNMNEWSIIINSIFIFPHHNITKNAGPLDTFLSQVRFMVIKNWWRIMCALIRLLDIKYFRYSILSNKLFLILFVTFLKSSLIDIEYSLLFLTGIEYSIISGVIGKKQYQYFFQYFFCWSYCKKDQKFVQN